MSLRTTMKSVLGNINRSDFYYFISSNFPEKRIREREIGLDLLGEIMVISLLAGLVSLMRFMLAK